MLSTDFQKNRQKIPITSMLDLRLKCARFYDMGIKQAQGAKGNRISQVPIGEFDRQCVKGLFFGALIINIFLPIDN